MVKADQRGRLAFFGTCLCLALAGLGGRLYYLQILQHDRLSEKVADNTRKRYILQARRGEVRDIKGHVLGASIPVKTICADPVLIGKDQLLVAKALAPILKLDERWIADRLQIRVRRFERVVTNVFLGVTSVYHTNILSPIRYVVLKHKVPVEDWQLATQAMSVVTPDWAASVRKPEEKARLRFLREKAVFSTEDQVRVYPNKQLAAHVLGFTGTDEVDTGEGKVMEMSGKDGIEVKYDKALRGVTGWRQTEADSRRRELVAFREYDIPARPGNNVILTIDSRIQDIVETAMAEAAAEHSPKSITATVIRPMTGELLALANWPTYDPNAPGASPPENRLNRAIAAISEPGSTFKIVVVSGALNESQVTLEDRFDCENGVFYFAGTKLHDHVKLGILSVQEIIMKSSNIGAAKIGIKLGKQTLYNYIKGFGFNSLTGLPLPGEVAGIVHAPDKWTGPSISRVPMGHEVTATPLQMVMAMCTIANGGKLMRPILVHHLQDETGRAFEVAQPTVIRQVITPETAKKMVEALKTVVSPNGTAAKAQLDHYTAAGKTGTAQKAGPGGYMPGKYFSSFIGFFPADSPEVCISFVMDEPKSGRYGGDVAAPYFKQIAEQIGNYLNIRPDKGASVAMPQKPSGTVQSLASMQPVKGGPER